MNLSKRMKSLSEIVDRDKFYEVNAGLELVKKTAKAKFDESIDAAIKLGIDPKKSDQLVRGALVLPVEQVSQQESQFLLKVMLLRMQRKQVQTLWVLKI